MEKIQIPDENITQTFGDDSHNDAEKGAAMGGLGGAAIGAIAGSMVGPIGALAGGLVGGLFGAGAGGMAVNAVDKVDYDTELATSRDDKL